jgi:hypothetical protein
LKSQVFSGFSDEGSSGSGASLVSTR